jgi:hypothetical protein
VCDDPEQKRETTIFLIIFDFVFENKTTNQQTPDLVIAVRKTLRAIREKQWRTC